MVGWLATPLAADWFIDPRVVLNLAAVGRGRTVSRVLYPLQDGDHLSAAPVARRLQRPIPEGSASSLIALLFGLAPGGVCLAGRSPGRRWALTPPFHPCLQRSSGDDRCGRCNFCGTFLRVAP